MRCTPHPWQILTTCPNCVNANICSGHSPGPSSVPLVNADHHTRNCLAEPKGSRAGLAFSWERSGPRCSNE
jgi:hypothetical protein